MTGETTMSAAGPGRSSAAIGQAGPRQLRRLLDAVMSLGSDLELSVLLTHIVETGRDLVGARFAALGVVDATKGSLVEFITVGIDDAGRAAIGDLPKGHGILGLLITTPRPLRLPDLTEHEDRFGFPANHPPMHSFLGVPLYVHGEVFGNLYFTEKLDGEVFTDIDEELAVALAGAAAIAIENARLHQRTQELTLMAERERFGRDLHDTVIQRVFATGLALHTTARMATEPEVQRRIVDHIAELDEVVRQLRTAIFQLDVGGTRRGSIRGQILAVATDATRALGFEPEVRFDGPIDTATSDEVAEQLVAVAREALSNVARHASASSVALRLEASGQAIVLTIDDDGVGIADGRSLGHGLGNMERRARDIGGCVVVEPGARRGTRVCCTVPLASTDG